MVKIRHPLLDELRQFDIDAAIRYPASFDHGLGQLGMLMYPECKNGGYWCTPKNTMAFAHTGGNGVHFSFIVENNAITEQSPVIVTVPGGSYEPNHVVGENLRSFLRFGLHRGYFALEQLANYRDLTLQVYGSPDWQPTEDWHYDVGYDLDENGKRVRDFLKERFELTPLTYTVSEFASLQEKYMPFLEYTDDNER